MSIDSSTEYEPPTGSTITLTRESDWWVATDEDTGVVSQGQTREDALTNLDEALAGYHGEGDAPTDEELRAMGIEPAQNRSGSLEDSDIFE